MEFENKTAIITGARRGIGKAIALAFAQKGANVVVSDIDKQDCEKVLAEIDQAGAKGLSIECDVTDKEAVEEMVAVTKDTFGSVDILVNNAGIFIQKPLEETSEEEIEKELDINLRGTIRCSQAVLKEMKEKQSGKIINIASIAGLVGFVNSSIYCASKGGIVNFTRELAAELGKDKINVNAIAPGVIETEMTSDLLKDEKTKKGLLTKIPYNRVGKPEDIANAASFLASEQADYITGTILPVDGGWLTL